MTSNDIYERLGMLEQLVRHLYEQTGVPMPAVRNAGPAVSPRVQRLLAEGNKIAAIKVFREETGTDLATAKMFIESL